MIVGFAAVLAFLVGVGVSGSAGGEEVSGLESQIAELTAEREEVEQASGLEIDGFEQRVAALEDELGEAQEGVAAAEELGAEFADREGELDQRDADLAEREGEVDQRDADLAERENQLDAREAELAQREAPADGAPSVDDQANQDVAVTQGGCGSGQVDINAAGFQELQRIHEIGPDRAQQIIDLRPFGSVDELTRVSGIAEGRLGGIKAQELACVN